MDLSKLKRKEIAYLAGVSVRTINNWKPPRNEDGSYDAQKFVKWLIDKTEEKSQDDFQHENEETVYWLTEFRKERARIARIERQKLEETLISEEKVAEEWISRVKLVTDGLELFSNRLAPLVIGKTRERITEIIKDEIWKLRNAYAKEGKYCPKSDK